MLTLARPAFFGLAITLFVSAAHSSVGEEIKAAGIYDCTGMNPDGSDYTGRVQITKKGDAFGVVWVVGEATYEGIAILEDRVLSVSWIQRHDGAVGVGIAVYTLDKVGKTWLGKWTVFGGDGKVLRESLTPTNRT